MWWGASRGRRPKGGPRAERADNPCPTGVARHMGLLHKTEEHQALVSWLDEIAPWETFFTASPIRRMGTKALVNTFERFMAKNYKNVSYAYSIEPYTTRGWVRYGEFYPAMHMHAMFDAGHDIKWTKFWEKWYGLYGRCKTEPIRHPADVESYVAKYMMKHQHDKYNNERKEIWWDVHLSKYRKRMNGINRNGSSPRGERRDGFGVRDFISAPA